MTTDADYLARENTRLRARVALLEQQRDQATDLVERLVAELRERRLAQEHAEGVTA